MNFERWGLQSENRIEHRKLVDNVANLRSQSGIRVATAVPIITIVTIFDVTSCFASFPITCMSAHKIDQISTFSKRY